MGWGLATMCGVAGKGETLDVVPRFLITGPARRRLVVRRRQGPRPGAAARRPLPRRRDRRRAVRLAHAHARRGQPRLRADGGAGRHPQRDPLLVIVERVEHPDWLSNAYLVADEAGRARRPRRRERARGRARAARGASTASRITHVLCTHGHADHVVGIEELARRSACRSSRTRTTDVTADERRRRRRDVRAAALEIRALYTPGHCRDHVAVPRRRHATASPRTCSSRARSAAPRGPTATSTS